MWLVTIVQLNLFIGFRVAFDTYTTKRVNLVECYMGQSEILFDVTEIKMF